MHFTTRKKAWTADTNNPSHKELTLDTITSATLQLEIYQEINTVEFQYPSTSFDVVLHLR